MGVIPFEHREIVEVVACSEGFFRTNSDYALQFAKDAAFVIGAVTKAEVDELNRLLERIGDHLRQQLSL